VPHHGIGYGVLRYQSGDSTLSARLAQLPQAQISFNYLGQFEQDRDEASQELFRPAQEPVGPLRSPRGEPAYLLTLSALITGGRLQVSWLFSTCLYRRATINTLAQRYLDMRRALIAHCRAQEAGSYTPSDFPELGLSQTTLDKIMGRLRTPGRESLDAG